MFSPIIWRTGLIIGLVAALCVLGGIFAMQSFQSVETDVEPVAESHDQVSRAVEEMDAAVAAYARTGDKGFIAEFESARRDFAAQARELTSLTEDDTDLTIDVTAELNAARAWIDSYGAPRLRRPGGPNNFEQESFEAGQASFEQYRDTRSRTLNEISSDRVEAREAGVLRFRLVIAGVLILALLAWIMLGRARTQMLTEISQPLQSLERVVQQMLKNDPEGRADARRGPTEVRAIARALNDFADAQSRAKAVEGRIQDELHVLDSAKDDFVSNVSHELRTPLTTISGYLELVSEEFEGRLEPRHERMLEATRRNVVRLRALIDDLLALSKAENRVTELEPADVTQMVVDAVTDVRMTAARRGIQVSLEVPEDPLLVVSDRAMLYRAFLNLLTNAVKFSHDDDSVEVVVRRVQHRVEIAIRDQGIGIPRAELDRLGTRFFRASNAMSNEIAGTGLGLRIVQTIVDKHAGDVIIESAEGEGTTVYVRLRLHGERAPRPARDDMPEARGLGSGSKRAVAAGRGGRARAGSPE